MMDNILVMFVFIHILLIVSATIVIVYNKEMTSLGKVFRVLEMIILPVFGPLFTLIEVLNQRVKGEKKKQ